MNEDNFKEIIKDIHTKSEQLNKSSSIKINAKELKKIYTKKKVQKINAFIEVLFERYKLG